MQPEETCTLKEILMHDTARIALLYTGLTFNSTNDKDTLANAIETAQLTVS